MAVIGDKEKFYLSLDLGTTSTRAHVIDKNFKIVGGARFESTLIQDPKGASELEPNEYFESIVKILQDALKSAKVDVGSIVNIGISCQRATFITWDKKTCEPFHNLITWKDERGHEILKKFNKSFTLKCINGGSKVLHLLTRLDYFGVTSKLKVGDGWLNHRLKYFLINNEELKLAVKENRAAYGALETWLLCRLRKDFKGSHLTDVSSCAATGIFDGFRMEWSGVMCKFFGIKKSILPKIVSNCYDFGSTHPDILGVPVPIEVLVTDQSASMIANACFAKWSAKITLGTGSFLQVNIGNTYRGSKHGANPLVAWNVKSIAQKNATIFKLEHYHPSSAESIKFAKTAGLCSDVSELSDIAMSVVSTDGVFFIPKLCGFHGIKQTTTKAHLARAVLEYIALSIAHYYFFFRDEQEFKPETIRIDGGIAQNNFICQQISNLTNVKVERAESCAELTSVGCAMLQAYKCGDLKQLEDAEKFYKSDRVFTPEDYCRSQLVDHYKSFVEVMEKYY